MLKYFKTCRTAEEGKKLYRELVKKYHTDNGTIDDTIIKEINAEYADWWSTHKDIHYDTESGSTYKSKKPTSETAEEFIQIIRDLSTIPDIEIEQTGSWLWIKGNTYPYRTQLNQFGCRYSGSKKCWYWAKDLSKSRAGHRGHNMNYIRSKYGSQSIAHSNPVMIE